MRCRLVAADFARMRACRLSVAYLLLPWEGERSQGRMVPSLAGVLIECIAWWLTCCLYSLDACACRGADKGIKNAEGKTAGEVADMNEQAEVVKLLG